MKGRAWTPEENEICMCEDFTLEEIAYLLDRTIISVSAHASRLKRYGSNYLNKQSQCNNEYIRRKEQSLDITRRYAKWDPIEDLYILDHLDDTEASIAEHLGRSIGGVRQRKFLLRREEV